MSSIIKEAIKNGKFILYYQPRIDIKTKKIKSVEALITDRVSRQSHRGL